MDVLDDDDERSSAASAEKNERQAACARPGTCADPASRTGLGVLDAERRRRAPPSPGRVAGDVAREQLAAALRIFSARVGGSVSRTPA